MVRQLAAEISAEVGERAQVVLTGEEQWPELTVKPVVEQACPFVVHLDSDDEVTIEFGVMSVCHFASSDREAVASSCREAVLSIIKGQVRETVWSRKGPPCRSVAYLGSGPEGALKVRTRRGLCLFPDEQRQVDYVGYLD
jgi:hypothetical protein